MNGVTSPIDGKICMVTGAAGYLGRHLVRALTTRGCPVRALDLAPSPDGSKHDRVRWIQADILDRPVLDQALDGVQIVFHTAAIIELSRRAPRRIADRVRLINVEGTRRLVRQSAAAGVKRLIHTSSTNVVFGQQTDGGDEYGPYSRSHDLYSSTKVAAERLVLQADQRGGMRTCALRPGGIYGPGERQTLVGPIVRSQVAGLPLVVIGDGHSRLDFTYIDNLVDAQLSAADRLVDGSPVGGEAYFITDGSPINPGELSIRLVHGMGLRPRVVRLPAPLAHALGIASEFTFGVLGRPRPSITRTSARLCTTANWFRNDKAREALDYSPKVGPTEGVRRMALEAREYYDALVRQRSADRGRSTASTPRL